MASSADAALARALPASVPRLSARGEAEAAKVTPFWATFDRMLSDAYCARDNPSGIINLGIANNSLMEAELLDFFHRSLALQPSDLTYGTSLFGSTRLFAALCTHYNSAAFAPVREVLPKHLITGPGCGSLLDQVFLHLAGDGDAVLCAAPYYNGFDADLNTRANVTCVPVFSPSTDGTSAVDFSGETALRGFEASMQRLHAQQTKCAAVLLCNPHNPSGRCYDREALIAYGRFVEKHDLHLVVDEIYALSTYRCSTAFGPDQGFISALNIDWLKEAGCNPGRVHIVSSSSKDWGINGFRVGSLISQHNPTLLKAMMSTAKLYMVSSPSDALFSALLTHPTFYGAFVRTNQARLGAAYRLATQWLQHHGINYSPANAGHFVLADLERFMPRTLNGRSLTPAEGETALWARALDHRVCVTPGSNYHHPRLGMFRLTFSLPAPAMLEGLSRLERALGLQPWSAPPQAPPVPLGLSAAEIDAPLREAALAPAPRIKPAFEPEPASVSKALSPGAQAVVTALCGGMPHLSLQDSRDDAERETTTTQQPQTKDNREEVYARLVELLAMTKTAPCAC